MATGFARFTATRRSVITGGLLAWCAGASAHAQVVRGVVVDAGGRPVPGVVVLLLKNDSAATRTLSNTRGEYRLVAPAHGAYRLRALRIGFRPSTSEPFEVHAGVESNRPLRLSGLAVSLDTVRIAERSSCQLVGESAAATYAVWEQVRTALTAAQLTDSAQIAATTVTYERTLDPSAKRVWKQSYSVSSALVSQPWISRPPESLHRSGYVASTADASTYFAPGIDALLSSDFLGDHCVRLTGSPDPTLVGLAFEPTPERRDVPEIRGTLWVDRQSAELRHLEFGYANIPRAQQDRAGGDLHFARMSDGQWVISRWNIRMPRLVLGLSSGSETRVAEIKVVGGELSMVRRGADTLWSRPPLALSGTVSDSISGTLVADATVMLRGTHLQGATDADGRFRITGVLPGEYTIDVRTPALDSLSAVSQSALIFTDSTRAVSVRVPSSSQVAMALCGSVPLQAPGILVGNVDMIADSLPRGIKVLAEWYEAGTVQSGGSAIAARRSRWLEVRTDANGRFRLCGVPVNTALQLRASGDGASSPLVSVQIPASGRFARADIILERASGTAVFAGSVVADSTNTPLIDAEVAFPGLARSAITNERGAFRIADIPEGRHRLTARRIGYGALDDSVAFEPNQVVQRRIVLGRGARLDTVVVVENVVLPAFEENRKLGLGVFLTRADLARQQGRKMGDILTQVRGLIIARGSGNYGFALGKRVPATLPKNIGTDCGTLANPCSFSRSDPGTNVYCPSAEEGGRNIECGCYTQVYRDKVLLNNGRPTPPFDVNEISADDVEAVEFYGSAAETPMEYAKLNSPCGVLVFHTRRSQ